MKILLHNLFIFGRVFRSSKRVKAIDLPSDPIDVSMIDEVRLL